MVTKNKNYYNAFIDAAGECPAVSAEIHSIKGDEKTAHYEYLCYR